MENGFGRSGEGIGGMDGADQNLINGWLHATRTGCEKDSKVDIRVLRTQSLLQGALRELLQEQPISQISVSLITARAQINRATFYAHFEDKNHLLEAMLRHDLTKAVFDRVHPPAPFDENTVTAIAAATFEFMDRTIAKGRKHSDEFAASMSLVLQDVLESRFLMWFSNEPNALKASGKTAHTMANLLAWSIYGAAIRWSRSNERPDAETAARETVEILFGDIRSQV